jgi:hypothetical protein
MVPRGNQAEHRRLKTSLFRYVLHSRFFAILTGRLFTPGSFHLYCLVSSFRYIKPFVFLSMAYRKRGAGIVESTRFTPDNVCHNASRVAQVIEADPAMTGVTPYQAGNLLE